MLSKEIIKKRKITAIILAAGNSTRFGKNRNKNFEKINEKTILSYSLIAFEKNKYVDDIILAIKEKELDEVKNILKQENITKNVKCICGGKTRNESVYNCIKAIDSDIVIIHDGARPLIKQDYINECVKSINEFDGVTMGVKVKDTIKLVDYNNIVMNTTKRDETWMIQTPQCFNRDILFKMHEKYQNEDVTDDCELLEKDNYKIKVIEGNYTNIKITTYDDLDIAKCFLTYF